jgi:hypothetical protein
MATSICPNCGKPLRPGSRFCGNCGTTLPASPRQAVAPADAQPGAAVCPHCGKPLRSSSKFCSNCGKPLEMESQSAITVAVRSSSTAEQARPPAPAPRPVPAGAPAGAPAHKAPAGVIRRKGVIAIAIAGLLVVCVILAVGGYFGARQLGFIGNKTAVSSVVQETVTPPAPLATTAPLPVLLSTATEPVQALPASPSPFLVPTEALPTLVTLPPVIPTVQTPITVNLASPTVELLPTETPAIALAQVNELFDDTFDNDSWRQHWRIWGEPKPIQRNGGGGSWLSLAAVDFPGSAGITTRSEFPIPDAPGVEIEFEATLNKNYPGGVLLVDWDPRTYRRGPENTEPGLIRLVIRPKQLLLSGSGTNPDCPFEVDALQKHTYLIRIQPGQVVEVYLDQAPGAMCQVQLAAVEPQPGNISFSGIADLNQVRVSAPPSP